MRRWIRVIFLAWAVISSLWLANSMRTRDVGDELLRTSATVVVRDQGATLEFLPSAQPHASALIFFCGSGVAAEAYAPLLRPLAEAGHAVFIVRLPYRFAPFESHKQEALQRARNVMRTHGEISKWVIAGHSLGGALAARMSASEPSGVVALVLIGTTHPRKDDLSALRIPVTKVYATNDGVAPMERVRATRNLLPATTKWVEIRGGNHSQFGHYGHQLLDGKATISREAQQRLTRSAIMDALEGTRLTVATVAGCYEITLYKWEPALDLGEDAEFIEPPRAIELRLQRGPARLEKETFLVRPAPGAKPSIHRFSLWEVKDSTVFLTWTTGFSGLRMELNPAGNDLEGTATSFWDFGRPEQQAHVLARRTPCAAGIDR